MLSLEFSRDYGGLYATKRRTLTRSRWLDA